MNVLKNVKFNVYVNADMKKKIAEAMIFTVKKTLSLDLAKYFKMLVSNISESDAKCIANMKPVNVMNR